MTMWINILDNFSNNLSSYIASWGDSSSEIKGFITIRSNANNDPTICVLSIRDNVGSSQTGAWGTAYPLTVRYIAGSLPSNQEPCVIDFHRNGDKGNTAADVRLYTQGTPTWTKPTFATNVYVMLIGGGAGGGSGAKLNVANAWDCTGGAGGGSGAIVEAIIPANALPSSVSVVVGAHGTGGAAITTGNTNGLAGQNGGPSKFGYIIAPGGKGGDGGRYALNLTVNISPGVGGGGAAFPDNANPFRFVPNTTWPGSNERTIFNYLSNMTHRITKGMNGGFIIAGNDTANPPIAGVPPQDILWGTTGGGYGGFTTSANNYNPNNTLGSDGGGLIVTNAAVDDAGGATANNPSIFTTDQLNGAAAFNKTTNYARRSRANTNNTSDGSWQYDWFNLGTHIKIGLGGAGGALRARNTNGGNGGNGGLYGGGGGGGGAVVVDAGNAAVSGKGGDGGGGCVLVITT